MGPDPEMKFMAIKLDVTLWRLQHLLNRDQRHAFHPRRVGAVRFQAGRTRKSRPQDDVPVAVGAGQRGIGRAEDGDDGRADRGGEVHRAAVVSDEQSAAAVEFGELGKIGLAGQIEGECWKRGVPAPQSFRGEGRGARDCEAYEDGFDAQGSAAEPVSTTARAATARPEPRIVVPPEFGVPTGGRVDGRDERSATKEEARPSRRFVNRHLRIGVGGAEREFDRPGGTAEMCGEQISFNGVGARGTRRRCRTTVRLHGHR